MQLNLCANQVQKQCNLTFSFRLFLRSVHQRFIAFFWSLIATKKRLQFSTEINCCKVLYIISQNRKYRVRVKIWDDRRWRWTAYKTTRIWIKPVTLLSKEGLNYWRWKCGSFSTYFSWTFSYFIQIFYSTFLNT